MSACRQFLKWRFSARLASGSVIALGLTAWSGPALAYRPFDGTDAAVAAPGELEIELQPAGGLHEERTTTLVAPATVFNYGLSEGWEAVFESQGQTPLSPSGPTSLTAAGAFLKHVRDPALCRTRPGRASRRNLACCFQTAPAIQASVQAWLESFRSGGIGERSI